MLWGKSSWMCPCWGRWASLRSEAADGWWKKRFAMLDESEVAADSEKLDGLKYLEAKGEWSNWERGVDEQIFVVSAIKTPLWWKESSQPCTYEVRVAAEGKKHDCNGAAWMGSALETGWGSWRSKWSSEQSHCFYALSGWLGCMHICSGCVPRELFQSDPAGRTADPGQIRKFTCFIFFNSTFN